MTLNSLAEKHKRRRELRLLLKRISSSLFVLLNCLIATRYLANKVIIPREPLVIISFDGFRHDYIEIVKRRFGPLSLPNFDRFSHEGVRAIRCINVFPPSTLPTHQTMVTGLHPQHHGIPANTIIDERFPAHILSYLNSTSLVEDPWLDGWPEPIWRTAQKNGVLVGSLLWPITDRPFDGDLPVQLVSRFKYNSYGPLYYPNKMRIDDLLRWLTNGYYKLGLILVYISEVDIMGHLFGPYGIQTAESIVKLDALLGYFLDRLEAYNIRNSINIILTADHGMTETSSANLIILSEYINPETYIATQLTSIGYIYPFPGHQQHIYDTLKYSHPRLSVYKLHEVPRNFHFNIPGLRMPPIVLVADLGWSIVKTRPESPLTNGGQHGYTPEHLDMNPFFIASGPAFLREREVSTVHTIDIYALSCHLIGIEPGANNGSLSRISEILSKD